MKTFDEFVLEHIDTPSLQLIHNWYRQLIINQQLEETINQLKKDLEESRACEDPVLAAHRKLGEIGELFKPRNMCKYIAERERVEGIPIEDLEGNE